MQDKGYKETTNKLDMSLLPLRALIEVAQVFHYGMLKYSRDNWLRGLKQSEIRQAQRRHEGKFDLGEPLDSESGLLHLAHKACLALMELELSLQNKLKYDVSEKPVKMDLMPADKAFGFRFNKPKNVLDQSGD